MASTRFYINKSYFKTLRTPLKKLKPPIDQTEQQGAVVLKRGGMILRYVNDGESTGLVAVQTAGGQTIDYVSLHQPHTDDEIALAVKNVLELFSKAEKLAKQPKG